MDSHLFKTKSIEQLITDVERGERYKGEFMLVDRRYCYPLTVTDFASRYLIACEALGTTAELFASVVFRPVLPPVRSVRARVTHSRSAASVKSRSRATLPTVLPSSSHQPEPAAVSEPPARPSESGGNCRPR